VVKKRSQNCEKRLLSSLSPSVCPPVLPPARNNLPTGRIFMKFNISIVLENLEKIQDLLKSDEENGNFTLRPMYIFDSISLNAS